MAKFIDMISDSLKERVEKVVSKPKRRRIKPQMVCSSDERFEAKCREIRHMEHEERQEQLVPVLFMFGSPYRILDSVDEQKYKELNMRIEYMKQKEAKNLIK